MGFGLQGIKLKTRLIWLLTRNLKSEELYNFRKEKKNPPKSQGN